NSRNKTYGTTLVLGTTAFSPTGLVVANGDTITGVTLTSTGAAAGAAASPPTYAIVASAATGSWVGNYTITYHDGTLTVDKAALDITANTRNKTYGTTLVLGTTAFSQTGLVVANGDTITGVTLTSTGAAAGAAASPPTYAIVASAATGSGLSNYTITYHDGTLTVDKAALDITANTR